MIVINNVLKLTLKFSAGALLIVLIGLVACTSSDKDENPLLNPECKEWRKEAPELFDVKIKTTKGDFVIEFHKSWAPIGVNRVYNLVRLGFYDDSRFYRVRENYIMQFGIAGKPEVAQAWEHIQLKDDPVTETNIRSVIAFAMTGPDTRTTQLYINLKDNTHLDEQGFSPLGFVREGMDVVDSLYSGYGETSGGGMRAGKQQKLFEEGNEYLDSEFPKLDKLLKAEIIER